MAGKTFFTLHLFAFFFLVCGCAGPGLNRFGRAVAPDGAVLYHCRQPDAQSIVALREMGIGAILNLRDDPEPWEEEAARQAGLFYVNLPLSGLRAPTTAEESRVQNALDNLSGPVAAHCYHGRDRTMTAVCCWLIRHGMSPAQALAATRGWGPSVPGMRHFIRSYRPPAFSLQPPANPTVGRKGTP